MDAMVPLCDECPRCAWICDNLPHQSSIDDGHAYRHHPSLPSEKHRDIEEEWLRIVQSRALYNGDALPGEAVLCDGDERAEGVWTSDGGHECVRDS